MKKYILLFYIIFLFLLQTLNSNFNNDSYFAYPSKYTDISSFFGNRELYGTNNFHSGIDFLAPQNSEIYASKSGYVEYADFLDSGFGNTVIINHGQNIQTLYCHISETFLVKVGDFVHQGDIIGTVGPMFLNNGTKNGNTTGPHLHFSIIQNNSYIDPILLLNNKK